jgi:hypothetical protein
MGSLLGIIFINYVFDDFVNVNFSRIYKFLSFFFKSCNYLFTFTERIRFNRTLLLKSEVIFGIQCDICVVVARRGAWINDNLNQVAFPRQKLPNFFDNTLIRIIVSWNKADRNSSYIRAFQYIFCIEGCMQRRAVRDKSTINKNLFISVSSILVNASKRFKYEWCGRGRQCNFI